MKRIFLILIFIGSILHCTACQTKHQVQSEHKIAPIEVKPIHITIDVNIKIDKSLDDFFSDIDKKEERLINTKE